MTTELFELREKRTKLHIKFKQQPLNADLKKQYQSFRNSVTTKINIAKTEFYKKSFYTANPSRTSNGDF